MRPSHRRAGVGSAVDSEHLLTARDKTLTWHSWVKRKIIHSPTWMYTQHLLCMYTPGAVLGRLSASKPKLISGWRSMWRDLRRLCAACIMGTDESTVYCGLDIRPASVANMANLMSTGSVAAAKRWQCRQCGVCSAPHLHVCTLRWGCRLLRGRCTRHGCLPLSICCPALLVSDGPAAGLCSWSGGPAGARQQPLKPCGAHSASA